MLITFNSLTNHAPVNYLRDLNEARLARCRTAATNSWPIRKSGKPSGRSSHHQPLGAAPARAAEPVADLSVRTEECRSGGPAVIRIALEAAGAVFSVRTEECRSGGPAVNRIALGVGVSSDRDVIPV